MESSLVVMGVAGCGKSSVAQAIARVLGCRLVEGDEFHSDDSRDKMRGGVALTDADRADWLDALAGQLHAAPRGIVMACSALKRSYRERLRAAAPGLRFVFLRIERDIALQRVAGRDSHFFSPSLVSSQFAALEDPGREPGVLTLEATAALQTLTDDVLRWIDRAKTEETR